MQETILIIYLIVAIALVGIILIQQGKGAEMGASFGAGGANTVFGAAGSGNALTKATTVLAILFFGIALSISYLKSTPEVIIDDVFDEAQKVDIESVVPAEIEQSNGIESELPTALENVTEPVAAGSIVSESTTAESEKNITPATKEQTKDSANQ